MNRKLPITAQTYKVPRHIFEKWWEEWEEKLVEIKFGKGYLEKEKERFMKDQMDNYLRSLHGIMANTEVDNEGK